jgi:DNA-binding beta-propeller fold protein YncE
MICPECRLIQLILWLSGHCPKMGRKDEPMKRISKVLLVGLVSFLFGLVLLPALSERGYAASRVYWTDAAVREIQRASLDGSGVEILVPTGAGPSGIALDVTGGKMYWAEADGLKIRRSNLDGSAVEDLLGSVGPVGIALDVTGGKMYWTDVFVTGKIQRANLDGSGVEDLVAFVADREGIAMDIPGGKMYWTERSGLVGKIQRANLDGSAIETLISTGLIDPREIALDLAGGKMYWTDALTHKIQRANLDGSGVEDLVTGLGNPAGIALDLTGGKMYWTDFGTHEIQRANLNGSDVEDLVTGLSIPVGIALELPPSVVTVAIDVKPGSFPNSVNPRSRGVIPVGVLTTDIFDATTIDPTTVRFGVTGIEAPPVQYALEDIDGDGRTDQILHFNTQATGIQCGVFSVSLTGKTFSGQAIVGSDSINTVGCK